MLAPESDSANKYRCSDNSKSNGVSQIRRTNAKELNNQNFKYLFS
jgi:hypothetical protein